MESANPTKPIIQIHPTRRCNLRCLHCYSSSGPDQRDAMPYQSMEDAITDASEQGYGVASFSGGEPVLYPNLGQLLRHAKGLGMRTTVTSNGMLLSGARLEMITGVTDVLAISLDGIPQSHNKMRVCDDAFERMQSNLEGVRNSGIDFGFIFTLTQHNVDEVDWAANFAVEQGAKLFQIHPLEEVGRAGTVLAGSRPDELESAYAFIEAERLRQQYAGRLCVQLDVFHRELVQRYPKRFYADADWQQQQPVRLADCVTPLILEADGTLAPLGYGFARRYSMGNILDRRLRDLAPEWMAHNYPEFRELCTRVYAEACTPSELPLLNWYELVGQRSAEPVVALAS